jgi:hypothetical protein
LPEVLGCKAWLPGDVGWGVFGDARTDGDRIVLTPADAPGGVRWGQTFLRTRVDAADLIEVAFTFAFTEATPAAGFAEGAAFWFAPSSSPFAPLDSDPTSLGVPSAAGGVALALDMRPTAPASGPPFWGLYGNRFLDGSNLGSGVRDESAGARSPLGAGSPPAGPHTAVVRLRRLDEIVTEDDVEVRARTGAAPDAPALAFDFVDGGSEVFDGGFLGFSAGTTAPGGAEHALLGVEVKVDGTCLEPSAPP